VNAVSKNYPPAELFGYGAATESQRACALPLVASMTVTIPPAKPRAYQSATCAFRPAPVAEEYCAGSGGALMRAVYTARNDRASDSQRPILAVSPFSGQPSLAFSNRAPANRARNET